jgi:apolipoprotein N-acyltransferase
LKRNLHLLLAIAGAVLLTAAWPTSPLTLLIFIAWIPLLWIESTVPGGRRFFGFTYLIMFTWNVATTWWVWNASPPGAAAAFFANSLIMCLPWIGFRIVKKRLGEKIGYLSLIAFWMTFEYIHLLDWGLSWPWLTLGNVFATHPQWIQWYEYTGTSGGTLWVMVVKVLLFLHVKYNFFRQGLKTYKWLIAAIVCLLAPVAISMLTPIDNEPEGTQNVVVVQPNIDPYQKVSQDESAYMSFDEQLQRLIHLSEEQVDANTALVVWPETALYMANGLEETEINKENRFLAPLWGFLQRHPNITLFTGVESYRTYKGRQTKTARAIEGADDYFYDAFNGSVIMDSSSAWAFYHKSMLVPGVETLPWFLKFIDKWFEKFGGTTAGYAKQKERTVLDSRRGYRIAPSICYESIYGEFMSKYIRNGANLICIITNDGWWGNTPGHKHHMNYARLRAIETRTWIARSANTGISCFINPYGTVINPQPWDTGAATKFAVPVNNTNHQTFFVKHGDLLSKLMLVVSMGLIAWTITFVISKRFLAAAAARKLANKK